MVTVALASKSSYCNTADFVGAADARSHKISSAASAFVFVCVPLAMRIYTAGPRSAVARPQLHMVVGRFEVYMRRMAVLQ